MTGYRSLGVFLVICFAVAGLGGTITSPAVESWYPTLRKPGFNPPDWAFGVAWSILFFLMAIAGWRIWERRSRHSVGIALGWYAAQLILNLCWSALFFGLRRPDLALVEVVVLFGAVVMTGWQFYRIDRVAGWLFVPYLIWVAFAAVLNFAIWRLNGPCLFCPQAG